MTLVTHGIVFPMKKSVQILSQSIPPPPNVGHCNDPPQTRSTSRHSPVATDQETARLIAHPPKVSHHNDPSSTWYSAPHETVTTNI